MNNDNEFRSRIEKREYNRRQSRIRKVAYFCVIAVALLTIYYGFTSGVSEKMPHVDSASKVIIGDKSSKKSTSAFYDVGDRSSSSSQSSSGDISSSVSDANSDSSDVSSSANDSTTGNDDTDNTDGEYAVLEPSGGQALYSWAIAHGTTADEIYQLNPGMTSGNWDQYIGQSIRIS